MQNPTQPDPLAACKRELSRAVAEINAGILAAGNPPAIERQARRQSAYRPAATYDWSGRDQARPQSGIGLPPESRAYPWRSAREPCAAR